MSEENVELVRRWHDGLARGELSLEICDPELLVENIAEFPITGPYHGHEGLRRWWEDVAADTPWASLIWVKDGKITRAVGYASRGRALKAAGLRVE